MAHTFSILTCLGGPEFDLLGEYFDLYTLAIMKEVSMYWKRCVEKYITSNRNFAKKFLDNDISWPNLPTIQHIFTGEPFRFNAGGAVKFSQLLLAFEESTKRTFVDTQTTFNRLVWGISAQLLFPTANRVLLDERHRKAVDYCLKKVDAGGIAKYFPQRSVFLESVIRAVTSLPDSIDPARSATTGVDCSSDIAVSSSSSSGGCVGATSPLKKRRFSAPSPPRQVHTFFSSKFKPPVTSQDLRNVGVKGYSLCSLLLFLLKRDKLVNKTDLCSDNAHLLWQMLQVSGIEVSPELLKFLAQAYLIGLVTNHCSTTMRLEEKRLVEMSCIVNKTGFQHAYFMLFCYNALTTRSRPGPRSEQGSRSGEPRAAKGHAQGHEALLLQAAGSGQKKKEVSKRKLEKMAQDMLAGAWKNLSPNLGEVFWYKYLTRQIPRLFTQNRIPPRVYRKLDARPEMKCKKDHARVATGSLFYSVKKMTDGSCGCEWLPNLGTAGSDFQHLGVGFHLVWEEQSMESWDVCELDQLVHGVDQKSLQSNDVVLQAHNFVGRVIAENMILLTAGDIKDGELVRRLSGPLWPQARRKSGQKQPIAKFGKKVPLSTVGVQYSLVLGALQEQGRVFWVFLPSEGVDVNGCLRTSLLSFHPRFLRQNLNVRSWSAPIAEPFVREIARTATFGASSGHLPQTPQNAHICGLVLCYYIEKVFAEALTRPGPHVVPLALSSTTKRPVPPPTFVKRSTPEATIRRLFKEKDSFWVFSDQLENFLKGAELGKEHLLACFLVCATLEFVPVITYQGRNLQESFLGEKIAEQERQCAIEQEQTRLDRKKHIHLENRARRILAAILGRTSGHSRREMEPFFRQYTHFVRIVVQLTKLLAENMFGALHGRVARTPANMAYVEALMKKIYPRDWMREQQ